MLTRCPACDTTFRITPEQLKARQGKVRCGECQLVFNALESLIEETIALAPVPAVPMLAEDHSPSAQLADEVNVAMVAVPPAPTFALNSEEVTDPPLADVPAVPVEPIPEQEPEPEPELPIIGEVPPPDPLLHEPQEKTSRAAGWFWALGGLLALLALLLQAAVHFRIELAVALPGTRPMLESICEIAGCTVELPSKAELMTIETSDLQPDAEQKGWLKLSATLRNRAPFAQTYPHLELSLTDAENKILARRVLRPGDYLPRGTTTAGGLVSGEFAVNVGIDSGDVGASGYRLYLFYP